MRNNCIRKGSNSTDVLLVLFLTLSVIIMVINISLGYPTVWNKVICVLAVLVSVYLCYVYRYNIGLFLVMVFIAYTNYSIVVGVYFDPTLSPAFMRTQFTRASTYGVGITCIYIFVLVMLWLSRHTIKNPESISSLNSVANENYAYNNIISVFAPVVYVILFMLNFRAGEDGARGGTSALGEYRTIIAIIGSYYCGRRRIYKWIWTAVIGVTSVLIMMSGNRVDMFGSAIFLVVFWYADIIDYKKVLLLLPVAVVVLVAVGSMRGDFSFVHLDIGQTVEIIFEDKLTYNGAIFCYAPALATIELTETTETAEKLSLLWQHIKYVFKIGAAGASNPDLSRWSRNYYLHYWGFASPIYFYFWVGYLGPGLFAGLVNIYNRLYQRSIAKKLCAFKDKLCYILSIYFVSNVGRWYEYGPMGLLRGMFICAVAFCVVYAFDLLVKQRADRFRRMD